MPSSPRSLVLRERSGQTDTPAALTVLDSLVTSIPFLALYGSLDWRHIDETFPQVFCVCGCRVHPLFDGELVSTGRDGATGRHSYRSLRRPGRGSACVCATHRHQCDAL